MNAATVPTVAWSRRTSQPPAAATIAKVRLLTKFIIGPITPPMISARMAVSRSRVFDVSNSPMVRASRRQTLITRCPPTVSSIRPFSSARYCCRAR